LARSEASHACVRPQRASKLEGWRSSRYVGAMCASRILISLLPDESGEWLWAIGCGAVAEATLCSREDGSAGCSVGNAAGACDD
jgi:hypothetical protein